jgi:hypothetical protein
MEMGQRERRWVEACASAACAPLRRSKPLEVKKWDFDTHTHAWIRTSDLLCRNPGFNANF